MMKLIYKFAALAVAVFSVHASMAQLLVEDFDYPTNDTIASVSPSKGWLIASGTTTNYFKAVSPGLSFSGYNRSGIGNSTIVTTTGQDIYKNTSTSVTNGAIYASFMLRVDTAKATGDYFFAFLPTTSTSTFTSRVFIRSASAGFFRVGVSKGAVGANETVTYSVDSFNIGSVYTLVMKYQYNSGSTTNDSVKVFVFSNGLPTIEPTNATVQNLGATGAGNTDATTLGRVCIRQGTAANAPYLGFDGLVVDDSWEGLFGYTKPVKSLNVVNNGQTSVTTNWTKPTGYVDSLFTTVVFLKEASTITTGTPASPSSNYTSDSNFASSLSSRLASDTAAKCIYKGDLSSVSVSNLNSGTTYYAVAYVIRDADSSYSPAVFANGNTQSLIIPPPALVSVSAGNVFVTQTKFGVKWLKNNYVDTTSTIVVFAKRGSAINITSPNLNTTSYTADSNWTNGSRFQNDTAARCVYKGDGDNVILDGLTAASTYYISAFVVRDADSSWSSAVSFNYTTKTTPSAPVTNLTAVGNLYTTATATWTLPAGYSTTASTVLVFAKADSAITTSPTTISGSRYTANTIIGAGTKLESDTLATCIYNGDLATVTFRGLQNGRSYHLVAYVVNSTDSVYSAAATTVYAHNMLRPAPVHNANFLGLTSATARVFWTKDSTYSNTKHSTLVFVKAGSSIKDSIPTRTVTSYFASTTFGAGTKYQHDTNAFCVFRADTNFVNITGLVNTNTYHISIWVVEDGDSVYSLTPTIVSGVTQLPPARSNISDINKINSTTGVPDSLAKYVKLSGIVYGFNQRNNGLTFVLRDATGGITVSSNTKNFGYTVAEGDSVMVQGIVATNRGLLQVSTIDTLISYTSGNALKQPSVVTALNENTENDLVKVEGLRFVTTPTGGNWPFATTIIRAVKSGTTDTFNIRLVSTSGLAGTPLPTTTLFNVVGLGGQISSSTVAPFAFDGYNVMPRTAADIELIDSLNAFDLVSPADGADVFVTDTISGSVQFTWTSSKPYPGVSNPSYQFMYDTVGGTFASPVISKTVTDTFLTLTHKELAQILIQSGVSTGQSYYGTWKVIATADGFSRSSSTVFAAQVKNSINSGLFEASATIEVNCYPNPVKDVLTVSLKDNKGNLELYDITGRLIHQQHFNATSFTVSVDNLKQGVYYLKIETANGTATQKLVKE